MYVQRDKGNKLVFFCKHELKSLLGMDLDALCISNKTHKAAAKLICAHIRMWNVQRVKSQNRRRGGGYLQDLKKRELERFQVIFTISLSLILIFYETECYLP